MFKKALPFMLGITLAACTLTIGSLDANADTKTKTVKNTEQVHQIIVDTPAKVILKTGKEFQVQSKISTKQKTKVTNQAGQIKIKQPAQKHLWGIKINFNQPKSVITVTIPQDIKLTDVNLNSKAVDVQLDNALENLSITSHGGDVHLTKTNPQNLTVKSESGDIKLNQVNVQNDNYLASASGNISLTKTQFKTVTVDSESGDIDAHDLIANKLKLDSESGDVNIVNQKTTAYDQVTINSDSGDVQLKNANIKQSEIDTASGELDLSNTKIKHANNSTE